METLTWGRLEDYLRSDRPAALSMGGTKGVIIGFDPTTSRLFFRANLLPGTAIPASQFVELGIERRTIERTEVLEVFTCSRHLFREFHRLAGLFAEEYERIEATAVDAFKAVIDRWKGLTERRELLTTDEQLGLMGELVVLATLIRSHGTALVSAWTGRLPDSQERHDFRYIEIDFEVKSTRSPRRRHVIHGLKQLEPISGRKLFLLSLRFERAGLGHGYSLAERVGEVRGLLTTSSTDLAEFESRLASSRYQDTDDEHYQDKYVLSDEPVVLVVNDQCPRLVSESIRSALGESLASRIGSDLTYRIDIEGLGQSISQSADAGILGLSAIR